MVPSLVCKIQIIHKAFYIESLKLNLPNRQSTEAGFRKVS